MPVISGGTIIEGSGTAGALLNAGAPAAGTDEVQTLTIGGTPTGGTFKLAYGTEVTGDIAWSATNATLVANVDAALEALPSIGTGGVTTAVGTMTAGIGTITLTFVGANAKKAHPTITVRSNDMTGTAPTAEVAETTPGVNATFRAAAIGAQLFDTTNKKLYVNTGTADVPTWTVAGTQT